MIKVVISKGRLFHYGTTMDKAVFDNHVDKVIGVVPGLSKKYFTCESILGKYDETVTWGFRKDLCESIMWEEKKGYHICRHCGFILEIHRVSRMNMKYYICDCDDTDWLLIEGLISTIDGEIEQALKEIYD